MKREELEACESRMSTVRESLPQTTPGESRVCLSLVVREGH